MMKKFEYKGIDENVQKMHKEADEFIKKYNSLKYFQKEKKKKILKKYLKSIGNNSFITQPFYCDYGKNITIGNNSFINFSCTMLDMADITIGNYVLIAPNVTLTTATHSLDCKDRRNRKGFASEIVIEDDVWIGANSIIFPGVVLKKGTVVGAGSVVTKSTEEFDVVVGNPARRIKKSN